MAEETFGSKAY